MLTIGLTGGIGSGKTSVANLFSRLGIAIIDTDVIARELVKPGQPALLQITKKFGDSVLDEDGTLNRHHLADICFNDSGRRRDLEAIMHPLIRQSVKAQLNRVNSGYAVVVVPLLVETGQVDEYDRILVVDCSEQTQAERVHRRDARSDQQIQAIMQAQASRQQRLDVADDIILNEGSPEELSQQVDQLDHKYRLLANT